MLSAADNELLTRTGEDFVAFRDTNGRVGLFDPRPPHRFVSKKLQQCNWAQACEGGLDTAHFSFLHMAVSADDAEREALMSEQDACIQDSQGFIADRTREHLGPTDTAIIQFRRLMLQSARDLRAGVEPPAAGNGAGYMVRSGSAVAPGTMAFADVMDARFGDAVGRANAPVSRVNAPVSRVNAPVSRVGRAVR